MTNKPDEAPPQPPNLRVTQTTSATDPPPDRDDLYDRAVAPSDIKKADILAAIEEYDRLGQEEFLRRYNFGQAAKFRVVYQGKFYDSKAIAGVAHGFSTGEFWTKDRPFGGVGPSGAVTIVEKRGFYVDHGELLFKLMRLHIDRTNGEPTSHQYVVLLWAMHRARIGADRLVRFNDVAEELAALLVPFAVTPTIPDPAIPWAALINNSRSKSDWWQSSRTMDAVTDTDVKRENLLGGLTQSAFWKASQDDQFVDAAVEVIAQAIGTERGLKPLLKKLGLTRRAPNARPQEEGLPEGVDDVVAAIESVANPRQIPHRRFSAVENKVIEERAVRVARDHFEQDLGYATEDVGATASYDVHATKGHKVVKVEVKGTTTDGAAVVLTRNEVNLHLAEHPNNALAVVRGIILDRSGDEPAATGGDLALVMPWKIDITDLTPIAFDYQTGL